MIKQISNTSTTHRLALAVIAILICSLSASARDIAHPSYQSLVTKDKPVAYWTFDNPQPKSPQPVRDLVGQHHGTIVGNVKLNTPGPRILELPNEISEFGYLSFPQNNNAAQFSNGSHIVIKDTGENSPLDFKLGQTITLEAWVNFNGALNNNQQVYVVGKGRTQNPSFSASNQNWALRMRYDKGAARISFLFRNADNKTWHRWNSNDGFPVGSGWHYLVVSYTFGKPDSIRGYIDSKPTKGKWDYAGPTTAGPIVDNDDVWIGSAMAGNPSSSFTGLIDEVAIYRKALSPQTIKSRYQFVPPPFKLNLQGLPENDVRVEIIEGIPERKWPDFHQLAPPVEQFTQKHFAFAHLPRKYNNAGIIIDRSQSYMLRAAARIKLAKGKHRLLLRSLNGARLWIDGQLIATNRFTLPQGDAHQNVDEEPLMHHPSIRILPVGHTEKLITFESTGKQHTVMVELVVGGRARQEIGEFSLSIDQGDKGFKILSPDSKYNIPFTHTGWAKFSDLHHQQIATYNRSKRALATQNIQPYWAKRRAIARKQTIESSTVKIPPVTFQSSSFNTVDQFINQRLTREGVTPAGLTQDLAFLRRITLDTTGTVPTIDEIKQFLSHPHEKRRSHTINRLLQDNRFADHWVSYFQDILAENPGILKPMLNNTGPFRWWIYESLLDNKPLDQFVTELVMMEGSKYYGGPAGFAMASQNDVPMAAKAHVLSQAFLGIEMKCARCHDAPFHDVKQKDLFNLAAMLTRKPIKIPESSSVPGGLQTTRKMLIELSIFPGDLISPAFPFTNLIVDKNATLPTQWLNNPKDTREQFALYLTWHKNKRFARVMANRIWRRYLGFGLVEPVDDWQDAQISHPQLLDYLAEELITSGYDMRHLSILILSSHTYQRRFDTRKSQPFNHHEHLFAAPPRRRMQAEQVVDSLFTTAGKQLNSEPLTMDLDGRSSVTAFLNLGNRPSRAWHFTSLSNERDRPSLAKPRAQSIVDVLKTFGWRETRQNPLTVRDNTPTLQQPAMLANSVLTKRIATLSDDSAFKQLALNAPTPEHWLDTVFLRILTRKPTPTEKQTYLEILNVDFNDRINKNYDPDKVQKHTRKSVSWSNHLSVEANEILLEEERRVRAGDPPSKQLNSNWRQRAEDVLWVLINSPEFIWLP